MDLMNLSYELSDSMIKAVDHDERAYQAHLVNLFNDVVCKVRAIIEHPDRIVVTTPVSMGKDSTVTLMAVLQAYKESIEEGKVEPMRPLLVNTVDTLVESLPMKMYVRYTSKILVAYAEQIGVNLVHSILTPPLQDEYFIRWASASKLIPSPLRSGDCSVVLKVDPSEKYIRQVMSEKSSDPRLSEYKSSPRVVCLGSRLDESARRSTNMNKQGLNVSFEDVKHQLEEIPTSDKASAKQYTYAPIKNFYTQEVFDILALCGTDPVTPSLLNEQAPIPSFLSSGALLLEIYGNGSKDVCELVVGNKHQGGCNGSARYGCFVCTMSAKDKSSSAISEYERWRALGSEYALRVRDWLFRVGHDNTKRAFHARSVDPIAYNRVLAQPNCLKSKYLEKMVWYASQLTEFSRQAAEKFKQLVDEGREAEFSGYQDILNDTSMNPKAKKQFLDMYRQEAQTPLIECFSLKHAIYLSLRWSIDGITSLPYRPLAIWEKVRMGESLPWPKTMEEYEATCGKFKIDKVLPNPVAIPVLKEENFSPLSYVEADIDLYKLYEMPSHYIVPVESDLNCSLANRPSNTKGLTYAGEPGVVLSSSDSEEVIYHIQGYDQFGTSLPRVYIELHDFSGMQLTMDGRTISAELSERVRHDVKCLLKKQIISQLEILSQKISAVPFSSFEDLKSYLQPYISDLNMGVSLEVQVPYLSPIELPPVPRATALQKVRTFAASPRIISRKNGKITKGNSRLRTYKASVVSSFEQANMRPASVLGVDFDVTRSYDRHLLDDSIKYSGQMVEMENIDFDDNFLSDWLQSGGIKRALEMHDEHLKSWMINRHLNRAVTFRKFTGSHVAANLFRTGGVVVKSSYRPTLHRILQRTHLFEQIGVFELANMSSEQLRKYGYGIDMQQHRNDKLAVLKVIRAIRNSRRRKAMDMVENKSYESEISNACLQFVTTASQYCARTLRFGLEGRLNCVFFDNPVSLVERGMTYGTWLRLYTPAFRSLSNMITSLYGRDTTAEVVRQNSLMAIARNLKQTKGSINNTRELVSSYRLKQHKLQNLLDDFTIGDQTDMGPWRVRWEILMNDIHEDTQQYLAFFPESKRSAQNFSAILHSTVSFLDKECSFVESCLDSIDAMLDKACQQAMGKTTLAERLKFMKSIDKAA